MRACPSCLSVYATDAEFCGLDGERLLQAEGDPLAGKLVGRYRLEAQIGVGASGLVYRALALDTGRAVAMKLLFGEAACDRRVVQRFRREAETSAKLRHPNVVSVLDFEVASSGLAYLVMELLSGIALDQAIQEDAPMPRSRAANIVRQIASGLAEAHRQGFVHRDLKPGNVMLVDVDGAETAKILDFGIVGRIRRARDESRLTKTGYVVGTPAYMAPEQIDESVELGPTTDLYALGAILYELLTGRAPFTGSVEQILVKKLTREPEPLVQHGALGRLALQLLARDPRQRPPSALHVSAELHRLSNPGNDAATVLTAAPWASSSDALHAPTLTHRVSDAPAGDAYGDTVESPVLDTGGVSLLTDPSPRVEPTTTAPDLPGAGPVEDSGMTTLLDEPGPAAEEAPAAHGEEALVVPVLAREGSPTPLGLGAAAPTASFGEERDPTDPNLPLDLGAALGAGEPSDATPLVEITVADRLPAGAPGDTSAREPRPGSSPAGAEAATPRLSPFAATQLANLREVAGEPADLQDTAVRLEPDLEPDAGERTVGVAPRPRAAPGWTSHKLTYAAVGALGFGIGLLAVFAVLAARGRTPEPLPGAMSPTPSESARPSELRGEKTVSDSPSRPSVRALVGRVQTATPSDAPRAEQRPVVEEAPADAGPASDAGEGPATERPARRRDAPLTGATPERPRAPPRRERASRPARTRADGGP